MSVSFFPLWAESKVGLICDPDRKIISPRMASMLRRWVYPRKYWISGIFMRGFCLLRFRQILIFKSTVSPSSQQLLVSPIKISPTGLKKIYHRLKKHGVSAKHSLDMALTCMSSLSSSGVFIYLTNILLFCVALSLSGDACSLTKYSLISIGERKRIMLKFHEDIDWHCS